MAVRSNNTYPKVMKYFIYIICSLFFANHSFAELNECALNIVDNHLQGFKNKNSNCVGVLVPEGVTHINSYAFHGGSLLRELKIAQSVTYIGDYAFAANRLTSVVLPENLTHIGMAAFSDNLLEGTLFLPTIKDLRIEDYAFWSNNLTGVNTYYAQDGSEVHTILGNVIYLGEGVFKENLMTGLVSIRNILFHVNSLEVSRYFSKK